MRAGSRTTSRRPGSRCCARCSTASTPARTSIRARSSGRPASARAVRAESAAARPRRAAQRRSAPPVACRRRCIPAGASEMAAALGWGALAASSLVIGGLLGSAHPWPGRLIGLVLAFGAGALISAVSFDLAEEGAQVGGPGTVAVGLAAGALTYFGLDTLLETRTGSGPEDSGAGVALALGALLDGIPEQLVLGIGIAAGEGVGVGLLVAIFVSNLPEAIGASNDLVAAGHSPRAVRLLWLVVAAVCTLATVVGFAIADTTSGDLRAAINGFAAGALLVMLIDSMIPEGARKAKRPAGLATVLGFAVAAGLSGVS